MSQQQNLNERCEKILKDIQQALKDTDLDKNVVKQLHRLIRATPYLDKLHEPTIKIAQAEVVKSALLEKKGEKQHIELAKKTLNELEKCINVYKSVFSSILHGPSPVVFVFTGLGLIFFFLLLIYFVIIFILNVPIKNNTIFSVIGAGALGGIISILARMKDIALVNQWKDPKSYPTVLFFTGFFKPLLGMAFAVFVYAVLNTGLLEINSSIIGDNNGFWFYFALAFLSGFSERFAPDVAEKIENVVTTRDHNNDKKGDENPENNPVG